ncbi:DAN domain-containing protein [Ditylenchus destructor]|uniref:DAN domain-containing protein n=1 Tax=Ditylenchus destructor TaxID=166010 RepID=A0AAD4NBR0_9BILA|nr:DAN domain-containing protein [Ditylenchus destructor]
MESGSREHTSLSGEAILEQTSSISPSPEDVRTLTTQSSNGIVNYNVLSSANNDHQRTEFHSKSRDAFLRLDSKPYIEPPLLPDEERRQIWLERHRHKHQHRMEKKEGRKEEIPGRKRVLTLTTVDFFNRNQTCTGDLFKHKVRMAGCEPKIIINRFCHGSCASFYIPKLRSKKLKATFRSCAACVPSETDLIQVKLNCPEREEKEIYRTVMRVKKCACRNIELDDEDDDTEERDY